MRTPVWTWVTGMLFGIVAGILIFRDSLIVGVMFGVALGVAGTIALGAGAALSQKTRRTE